LQKSESSAELSANMPQNIPSSPLSEPNREEVVREWNVNEVYLVNRQWSETLLDHVKTNLVWPEDICDTAENNEEYAATSAQVCNDLRSGTAISTSKSGLYDEGDRVNYSGTSLPKLKSLYTGS